MDDGFKDRVDKVFGSISSSSSSSSWSLTDAQVEKREWNRPQTQRDDDRIPVFSSSSSSHDDDWGDIRSSIGLDSTLDNEEEEDAFDKIAQGNDTGGDDRLYINAHNVHVHVHVLPTAKTQPMLSAEEASRVKSILKKRKTYYDTTKPAKRVRFDPTCKNADTAPGPEEGFVPTQPLGTGPSVPDYILNPSKYTRYTFDDSSHDGSNSSTEAYLELVEQKDQKSGGDLPKSLVFIPRKKSEQQAQVKQSSTQACSTLGIAAAEVQLGEISEMQEDDVSTKATTSQKPIRRYRSKMDEEEEDHDI